MQENGLFIYRIKQKQTKKTTPWKKKNRIKAKAWQDKEKAKLDDKLAQNCKHKEIIKGL